jgi:Mce-associated membrane protein
MADVKVQNEKGDEASPAGESSEAAADKAEQKTGPTEPTDKAEPSDEAKPAEPSEPSDKAELCEPVGKVGGSRPAEQAEAGPKGKAAPGGRPRPKGLVLTGSLVLVLVLLWAAGALLFLQHRGTEQRNTEERQATAVAQQVATDLTSLNATDAQEKIDSLTRESTGNFRGQIDSYAALVRALLSQNQAGSNGTVSAVGIEKQDGNSASVLVTVTAVVSNSNLPSAQPLSYRLAIQLRRDAGRWLASDVGFVQ